MREQSMIQPDFFTGTCVCEWVDDAAVTGQINHPSHHRSDLRELIITRFLSLAIAHDSCCVCCRSRGVGVDNCLQPLRNLKSDIHIPSHPQVSFPYAKLVYKFYILIMLQLSGGGGLRSDSRLCSPLIIPFFFRRQRRRQRAFDSNEIAQHNFSWLCALNGRKKAESCWLLHFVGAELEKLDGKTLSFNYLCRFDHRKKRESKSSSS